MKHREPTPQELEAMDACSKAKTLVMLPILFNGQERFAMCSFFDDDGFKYCQLIAILPVSTDTVTDMAGTPCSGSPPVSDVRRAQMN